MRDFGARVGQGCTGLDMGWTWVGQEHNWQF